MTQVNQQQTMPNYDPITLAILSKMLQGEENSSKWAQVLMQMQQQQQQQMMQMLMLMLTMNNPQLQQNPQMFQVLAQIMGQNMQMSQQQMQTFMQMLQQQYQQTLQLQKEAMEKSEKKIKEELKDTLEEFSRTIEYLASALAKPPETKSELDKFIEQLEKFSKLKQKIDNLIYSSPELMEKYKTPEGKPDYGALILDMIGKNLSQALEVLKYKYMTDAQKKPVMQMPQPTVQPQPLQHLNKLRKLSKKNKNSLNLQKKKNVKNLWVDGSLRSQLKKSQNLKKVNPKKSNHLYSFLI